MTATTKSRLKFLSTSAYLYSTIAPSTSAHLMQECHTFALNNDITLKETGSNRACKACGSISIPGWTTRTTIADVHAPGKKKKRKRRTKTAGDTNGAKQKQVLSECLACRRTMKTVIKPSVCNKSRSQIQDEPPLSRSLVPESVAREVPARRRSEDNLGSKKRAKARKQGGLQAMLDRSKVAHAGASEPRLDLMDLMRVS